MIGLKDEADFFNNLVNHKILIIMIPTIHYVSEKVNSEFPIGHTESGGKCMAQYFQCQHCHSRYTIGFNRQPLLIKSEITVNNFKKNLDN